MEEVEKAPDADLAPIRIFVGGLGVTVSASDLEKTFSSLGKVMGVDIIRTDGRSFAYMDFQPTSQKALCKLFSTYNGCVWKGGRLRLEKAKEHYLSRLRREWAEDAERMKGTPNDTDSDAGSLENSKCSNQEKMQLQIFFPKLKKVKSLPYSGTGKHKYSFQRVEIPPLPINFCDCEEHCKPSETSNRECFSPLDTQVGVINDDELNIMNSVMSKLFEREANTKVADSRIASNTSDCPIDSHVRFMEHEADESMEVDNLVTNITMQGDNCRLGSTRAVRWEKMPTGQEHAQSELRFSNSRPTKKEPESHRRQNTVPGNALESKSSEKAQQLPAEEGANDEFSSVIPKMEITKIHSEEPESSKDVQPIQNQQQSVTGKSLNGLSWVQKSSWKELVGETGNGSFSISQILPRSASMKQKSPKLINSGATNSSSKQLNSVKSVRIQSSTSRDSSRTLEVGKQGILKDTATTPYQTSVVALENNENQAGLLGSQITAKDNPPVMNGTVVGTRKEPERTFSQEWRKTTAAVGNSEVCTFMRSADSEREWKKARTALSGFLKKKTDKN